MPSAGAPAAASAWRISGMCRWVPPTPYGFAEPRISLASRFVLRLLPAPLGPTASTVTMSEGSMTPAATPGARLRETVLALQPGAAMRVAPTSCSPLLPPLPAPGKLGHAVRPGLVEVAAVEPVPLGDRLEPVVGSRVDDERGVGQDVGELTRLPVRQGEEDDVVARQHLGRRVLQGQVRERAQVRLVRDERLAGVRVRRDGADLDVGMIGEEAEDLATRIAGCAGDGDRIRHGFYLKVRSAWAGNGDTGGSTRWERGARRGRLRSAVALTSARGSSAHEERRGELRGRRHVATIAARARHPQIVAPDGEGAAAVAALSASPDRMGG